ncbi:hypothetical protein [Sinomonas atrocyanea]|nr:hypothetical protein [Sinomonas atrocyanea]
MALITSPVRIEDGAWIASRAMLLGGTTIGRSSVVAPNCVIGPKATIPANTIVRQNPDLMSTERFSFKGENDSRTSND